MKKFIEFLSEQDYRPTQPKPQEAKDGVYENGKFYPYNETPYQEVDRLRKEKAASDAKKAEENKKKAEEDRKLIAAAASGKLDQLPLRPLQNSTPTPTQTK